MVGLNIAEAVGEVWIQLNMFKPPCNLLQTVPRRYICCGSLMLLVMNVCI